MISDTLAAILRSNRTDFNARFVEARRRFPGLTGEAFSAVLLDMVDPVVTAVAAVDADSASETASVAYDAALELAGQNLAGPTARSTVIADGWRRLFPAAANHLAAAPRRLVPAVSNALHHLAATPGAHPGRWVSDMSRVAGYCGSVDEYLKLGQVSAWRAGLAHYRPAALQLLEKLPAELALLALGVTSPSPGEGGMSDILSRLTGNRWYNPAKAEGSQVAEKEQLRPAARVGAFRGFGGLFIEPPQVTASGTSILVKSGQECWLLTADCFGATFHRSDPALFAASAGNTALPSGVDISGSSIRRNGFSINLGMLGSISTAAAISDTLAVTSVLTHSVILVAMK